MMSQLFNSCELQQIHATDFASEGSLTIGIVFITVTGKLFEFIGFFIFWSRDFPNMVITLKS